MSAPRHRRKAASEITEHGSGHRNDDIIGKFLVLTIKNALRQDFYKSLWRDIDVDHIRQPSDLSVLPVVTKDMYRVSYMTSFDHTLSHYVSYSTGTTGALTFRHRSQVEERFIRWLLSPLGPPGGDPYVGIRLMTGPMHGRQMPVAGHEISIPAATGTLVQLRQCIELLTTSFRVYGQTLRPSHLSGLAVDVALLAQALRARGIAPHSLALRDITVMGAVDEGLLQLITHSFDVPPRQRYSTSEIFGGAVREPGSDQYVTDPCVVAEVVDDSGRALPDGEIGELTMTELYPFVQIQPLVRYGTGDIVQRVASPSPGRISFRYLGRRSSSVWIERPRRRVAVTYRPLADSLGVLPVVARWRTDGDSTAHFAPVGGPIIEISELAASHVCIRVGVSVEPYLYPRSAQEIIDRLWTTLRPEVDPDDNLELTVHLSRYESGPAFEDGVFRTIRTVGPARLAGPTPRLDQRAEGPV